MSVSHDNHVRVSREREELVTASSREASGAEEAGILTHVQREHLPEVGHVPRERARDQSAGTARLPVEGALKTLPDNVPEEISV